MKSVHPYLNFPGNAKEAFDFYRSVFGGEFLGVSRFRDFGDNTMGAPEAELDKIAHIALPLAGGSSLMASDVMAAQEAALVVGTNSYVNLEMDSAEEARRVFEGLAAGGRVEMALAESPWAELYGICADRYGVQWMVNYTGGKSFTPDS